MKMYSNKKMKTIIIATASILLSACASVSQNDLVNLTPSSTLSAKQIVSGKTFTLTSQDIRTAQYIAEIKMDGQEQVQPLHAKQNVRQAYTSAIYQQFYSQGFAKTKNSNNTLNIKIVDAVAKVDQKSMKFAISGKVVIQITAETPNGKFVKSYQGTGNKTGSFTASIADVEEVINRVSGNVLANIAKDSELTNYMKGNF
ncbi:YajG family lipoprotein [Vibrio hibernica]|uniref:YajG family lipoprotein n=1 Tax=Vibrio hibernica TaxID=2587465 RepID=UPI0039B0B4B8